MLETWQDFLGQNWTSFATVTVQDPGGLNHTSKSYGSPISFTGGIRKTISPMGRISEAYIDPAGRTTRTGRVTLASTLTADLTETTMTHDPDGFMLSSSTPITDHPALITSYTPDCLARVKTVTDPLRTTAYPNGRKTEFFYDKSGNRLKAKLHDGREHP